MKTSTIKHLSDLLERIPELETISDAISKAAETLCECHLSGGKVMVCGNGGSAADSEHIVGELMKSFVLPRPLPADDIERLRRSGAADWESIAANLQQGIPAISLNGAISLSTAIINDTDPFMTFAQQVYIYGKPGDVLIALSTSGGAKNVLNAVKTAKAFGLSVIGFTGSRPAPIDEFCDVVLKAPIAETFRVQEYHLPIYHTICLMVENEIFGRE
ncbi:MAG: D-sedoheptulose-7-phosphate isomerase [Armatimonadota bacterium]